MGRFIYKAIDRLIWAHDNKGEFSVKKLTNLLIEGERDDINFAFDKIWKLKVPPRVRNFLWMLAIDRVPTKDFLVKRGVHLQNIMNVCLWCEREQERANHLFFKCNFILIAIAATCWSVWLARNEMVFERKVLSMDKLIFHSKMRALLWVRAAFDECMLQERLWWLSSSKWRFDSKPVTLGWRYPPHGWLKFNISRMEIEEVIGCGTLFSRPCDAINVESAELGAIFAALGVIIEIGWRGIGLIIVEIRSLVAYNWLLNKHRRPWSQQTTFANMEMRLACVGEVALSKAKQHSNEMAETLATAV
ncbi:hypothetical protein ES332_D01G154800v1 [Gossypium tomentosum]|uniref:Reverse transcriptase zinc-binding domain-containing protein n=1 Tax=Gossypium tomentosum TaxID=34277 RepID=A0A5D2M9E8_GOSTO|nr:hypothetical protein ES332_D01G154800v1 [Gossypium tomentosum]